MEFAPGELPVPVPGAVAVDDLGTAIFGGTNGKLHFIGPAGAAVRAPVAVGTGALTAPVVVGSDGTWVPSDDGRVYRVTLPAAPADPAVVEMVCNTQAAVKGLALELTWGPLRLIGLWALLLGAGWRVRQFANVPGRSALYQPIAQGSTFFGAEGNNLRALQPRHVLGFPVESWSSPASLGSPIAAPLALRSTGDILALTTPAAGGNSLFSISPAGLVTPLAATGLPADGPVVRANGDVVVPEKGKVLSCWTSTGSARWQSAALPGVPLTPLLLAGDDAVVVADGHGNLSALDGAGTLRWTVQLAPAAIPLRPPGIFAPAGATLSTAYLPAANGRLYAVILDGRLDASAPWPKAFHDPRNTGNLSTALPP